MTIKEQPSTIAKLNDAFRQTFVGGRVMLTEGVNALDTTNRLELLRKVQQFTAFTGDNDPHAEHDFGKVEIDGQGFFWKLDYYDLTLTAGSEDPANPTVTTRVLTIMRTDEY